jgi:transposase
MPTVLRVRALTDTEREQIKRLSQARRAPARAVERARMIQLASEGLSVPLIAQRLARAEKVVRRWVVRFNAEGLPGLEDKPRSGRPVTYSREEVGVVVATALTDPKELGQAFGSWTFARLERYLNEERGLSIKRSRIHELLQTEGLRWREEETWFGARVDPDFAQKRGGLKPSTPSHLRRVW